jgi:hypothetical protein
MHVELQAVRFIPQNTAQFFVECIVEIHSNHQQCPEQLCHNKSIASRFRSVDLLVAFFRWMVHRNVT